MFFCIIIDGEVDLSIIGNKQGDSMYLTTEINDINLYGALSTKTNKRGRKLC